MTLLPPDPFLEDEGPTQTIVTPEEILNRMVWNTIPHNHVTDVLAELGLPVPSDEVVDTEHVLAHHRAAEMSPILHLIYTCAYDAALAMQALIMVDQGTVEDSMYAKPEIFCQILGNVTQAILSELFTLGLIHPIHLVVVEEEYDDEEDDEQ